MPRINPISKVLAVGFCLGALACQREEDVRIYEVEIPEDYRIDDDQERSPEADALASIVDGVRTADGSLTWNAPAGWQRRPLSNFINQGNFMLPAYDGPPASLTISVFPDQTGGLVNNVNRWREQLNQPPLSESEVLESIETIEVAALPEPIQFIRIDGTEGDGQAAATEGGFLFLEDESWFFKLSGPTQAVDQHSEDFREFLQSVRPRQRRIPQEHPATTGEPTTTGQVDEQVPRPPSGEQTNHEHVGHTHSEEAHSDCESCDHESEGDGQVSISGFHFELPEGWMEKPPGPMRRASFIVPGPEGLLTDVSVVRLDGGGASLEANARLWRNQLGLEDIAGEEMEDLYTPLTGTEWGHALLFEATSTDRIIENAYTGTILAALMPEDDGTWVVRMRGASSHVAYEKDNFIAFLQSLQIP